MGEEQVMHSRQQNSAQSAGNCGRPGLGAKAVTGAVLGMVVALAAAACSSGSTSSSSPGSGSARTSAPASSSQAATSALGAHSLPAQSSQTLPAFPAFYDAHKDVVVVTDAFPRAAAAAYHANYAPSLSAVQPASQPAWYIVRGPAAPGQIAVLGSEPGEDDYSPLWLTAIVKWKPGVTPRVLTSDNMILGLAKKGQLTVTRTAMVVNATVAAVKAQPASSSQAATSALGAHSLPAQSSQTLPAFPAFYDAHKDVVVVTDAFPRAAAAAYHANYAPSLSAVQPASQPAWYIVRGPAAPGQIAVLGSEPGEDDYSPLWLTAIVKWKPGVTPKVLTSDNMILGLAKKGQLTVTRTAMVVNATVAAVKAQPASSSQAATSALGAHSLPAQSSQTLPAFPAFYDAHKDVVVVTDAFPRAAAAAYHANYAPSLSAVQPASQPAWYIVRGPAAPGQIAVLGSEPGEDDYSPLWLTAIVKWKPGVTPRVLTSDNMILGLAKKGQLTVTRTAMVVNATVAAVKAQPASSSQAATSALGAHSLPAQSSQTLPAFPAFYDAHKDVVVVTDAFPRAAAAAYHANYAPSLSAVQPASQPAWYIVRGPAAPGQIAVLGSEPGEDDYSPLWLTAIVKWKPGVTPKVLTSDNMILGLAKKGQLTVTRTAMVVNATVAAVKAQPASSSQAATSALGAHSLPAQSSQTLPAFPAFYDAHKDVVVVTDAFPRAAAAAYHANYAPSLSAVQPASQPAWYIVRGPAAPGQIAVLGSEPGEDDYSPLWLTAIVKWKPGVTPKVLTSDNMILGLAKKGQLTVTRTAMVVNATVAAVKAQPASSSQAATSALGAHSLPAQSSQTLPAFPAFYDAHKDVVVVTDAFPRAAAAAYHANYAPSLSAV